MSTKPFYNHIAGLRGIAIFLVFLFHLCSSSFPHGFYGVDIFLVITGYLLFLSFTRKGNQLNLKDFASKKLFRIFPPMIIAILLTLMAGMLFQDYENVITTSRTGRYSLLGFANSFLSKTQNDYFAADALDNPLLHMWYLSVTIHIYIIFAVGCVLYRFIPRVLSVILLWGIGIASFCYGYSYQLHNILQSLSLPVWEQLTPVSYYHTLPRVWEPLAGGAILLLPLTASKSKATVLSLLGLLAALIPALVPASIADYGVPLVVVGTMLIIRYLPDSCLMPILDNKFLLWVGSISFSLYLVHMPVITFFRSWYQGINSWTDYAIITLLSFVLAYLFWFLIEKRKMNIWVTLGLWVLSLAICILGKEKEGFKDYIYPESNNIRISPYDDWKFTPPETLNNQLDTKILVYNPGVITMAHSTRSAPRHPETPLMQMGTESTEPKVLLIGDSHAQASYYGLNKLCEDLNVPGVYLASIILPYWDRYHYLGETYFYNREKAEALIKWLEANPCITHVIISQFWRARLEVDEYIHWDNKREKMTEDLYFNSLREFLQRIKKLNRHVILVGPGPEIKDNALCRSIRLGARKGNSNINLAPISCTREDIIQLNKHITPMLMQLQKENLCTVLDTFGYIPEDKPFVAYKNGIFLMSDDDHMTGAGSTELYQYLKPQLEKALQQSMPVTETP